MAIIQKIKERIKERVIKDFTKTYSYEKKNAIDDIVTDRPFDFSPSWERAFLEAARHSFGVHSTRSDFYSKLCAYKRFDASRLKSFDDIWDIPYIFTDLFKHYTIETKSESGPRTEFNSSGTTGRKSRIVLDVISGQRILYSTYHIYRALGVALEKRPSNFLMMAYNPEIDDRVSTTQSDVIVSYFTPRKKVFYALDLDREGKMEFVKERAAGRLREFVEDGAPIRIMGFLHHACEVIKEYHKKHGRLELPKNSFLLTGGGWKNFGHLYPSDFDPLSFLREHTTLEPRNFRDMYTLNEHAIFYLECERHNMHIPNVSLVCARDPRTLKRLTYGETGLVHVFNPLVESCPLLSVLTTDYGYVGRSCGCSVGGPFIKISGRAGITKKTTCALTAEQYLETAGA